MIENTVVEKNLEMKSGADGSWYCGDIQPGELIDQYEIKEQLGTGGLARVFKAYDKKLDRYVALKILRPGVAASESAKKRFQQEINLQAKLSMPGCVSIFGAGEYRGMLYCAMEYVEGRTLRQILRDKSLDTKETIRILIKIVEIIKELHRRGLEHRDIKPGNIMLNKYNEVVLLDFGLAKAVEDQLNICVTSHGELLGTPAYMSPEQGGGDNKLYRAGCSDVYALGVLAFEMLTGTLPYAVDNLNLEEVFYVIRHEPPEPVTKYNKEVPPGIAETITRALTKEPANRISIEEFRQGLNTGGSNIRKSRLISPAAIISAAGFLFAVAAGILLARILSSKSTESRKGNADSGVLSKVSAPMASPQKIMTIPDTGITLVKLNGGTFLMGDDHGAGSAKPAHRVVLSPFFIGTHEISGKQYARIVGNAPSGQTDLELPANNVSWHDADRFCRLLTLRKKKAGRLPDDMQYRLPTEAEWEYACRAGSKSKYFFGDMFEELPEYVVCGNGKILKPGTKKPNKFGLYDMLGNVWEWCYDANGKYSALLGIDPAVAGKSHEDRIIRGGSADSRTDEFASSYRRAISPHGHTPLIGFRIVLGKKLNK